MERLQATNGFWTYFSDQCWRATNLFLSGLIRKKEPGRGPHQDRAGRHRSAGHCRMIFRDRLLETLGGPGDRKRWTSSAKVSRPAHRALQPRPKWGVTWSICSASTAAAIGHELLSTASQKTGVTCIWQASIILHEALPLSDIHAVSGKPGPAGDGASFRSALSARTVPSLDP